MDKAKWEAFLRKLAALCYTEGVSLAGARVWPEGEDEANASSCIDYVEASGHIGARGTLQVFDEAEPIPLEV